MCLYSCLVTMGFLHVQTHSQHCVNNSHNFRLYTHRAIFGAQVLMLLAISFADFLEFFLTVKSAKISVTQKIPVIRYWYVKKWPYQENYIKILITLWNKIYTIVLPKNFPITWNYWHGHELSQEIINYYQKWHLSLFQFLQINNDCEMYSTFYKSLVLGLWRSE